MSENSRPTVVFKPLDRDAEVDVSERNLPHWFQVDAAIFVTFRTADSLPKEVVRLFCSELQDWLTRHGLPTELAASVIEAKSPDHYALLSKLSTDQQREFKTLRDRLFHRSLDACHGACPFKEPATALVVANAIRKFDGERYDLDSFVIMPNHVHAIVQFRPGFDLHTIGQSWMRYTARIINQQTWRTGVLWQPEPFDHVIRSAKQFVYLHRYVADNPKKANLSNGEYIYWVRNL